MLYYFVNTGHEFGEAPFSNAKPFSNIEDAETEYNELEICGDGDIVSLYSFDTSNLKIDVIKCNYED